MADSARPTALVTGATAGIGRSFVDRLARDGHDLVLVARDASRLEAVADELSARHGVAAEVLAADLADRAGCARVEARVADRDRPVEVLVNNAGFGLGTSFADSSVDDEERLLDVLVRAVLRVTHAALGPMRERGRGDIVNVASVAAFLPYGSYSAAKAWVTTFSQSLAQEVADDGIRVIATCPGFVRTEFHQRMDMDTAVVPSWSWLDADAVVDATLRDLARGRSLVVPDLRYKVAVGFLRHVPTRLATTVASAVRR